MSTVYINWGHSLTWTSNSTTAYSYNYIKIADKLYWASESSAKPKKPPVPVMPEQLT